MTPLHIFYAILVPLIWGGNFVASKYAMMDFPPFLFTAMRFAIAGSVLFWFVPKPKRTELKNLAWLATSFGVLHFGLIMGAMYYGLSIASCAIAAQTGVPFSCILGAMFLNDKLGWRRTLGMVISFVGVFIVVGTPNVLENLFGFFIAIAGGFFWAVGNMVTKKLHSASVFQMLTYMSLLAVPQLLILSWIFEADSWTPLTDASTRSWIAVMYTAFGSTITAYGLWYFLLKNHPITYVAPFSLLAPVFSITFGQIFFAEHLTWHIMVGGLITLAGIAIIVMRRPKIVEIGKTE